MIWKYFYSEKSASEHGTLYQLRNLLNRVNVTKKPKKNFDACEDFLCTVLHSLLLMGSMKVLGMELLDDNPQSSIMPNCENLWMETVERRFEILEVSLKIIDSVVSFCFTGGAETFVDKVYDYNTKLLSLGCFYLEYCDAIREGDGERYTDAGNIFCPFSKTQVARTTHWKHCILYINTSMNYLLGRLKSCYGVGL